MSGCTIIGLIIRVDDERMVASLRPVPVHGSVRGAQEEETRWS